MIGSECLVEFPDCNLYFRAPAVLSLQRPFQGWRVFEYSGEAPTNFRSTSTSSCAAKVQHGDHDSPLLAA